MPQLMGSKGLQGGYFRIAPASVPSPGLNVQIVHEAFPEAFIALIRQHGTVSTREHQQPASIRLCAAQGRNDAIRDVYHSAARLRLCALFYGEDITCGAHGLVYGYSLFFKVNVCPGKRYQFPTPQAAIEHQQRTHARPVALPMGFDHAPLFLRQRHPFLHAGGGQHVAKNNSVFHGVVYDLTRRLPKLLQGLFRLALLGITRYG